MQENETEHIRDQINLKRLNILMAQTRWKLRENVFSNKIIKLSNQQNIFINPGTAYLPETNYSQSIKSSSKFCQCYILTTFKTVFLIRYMRVTLSVEKPTRSVGSPHHFTHCIVDKSSLCLSITLHCDYGEVKIR